MNQFRQLLTPKTQSPIPKIRLEKRTGGKFVTSISGLHTYGQRKLELIARELKNLCGAGGTVKNGTIEIQGDHVAKICSWFQGRPSLNL